MSTRAKGSGKGRKPKAIERPGLSEDEIEEIREAFNLFDTGERIWVVCWWCAAKSVCV